MLRRENIIKVSFVIPAYNEEKVLALTLDAIVRETRSVSCKTEIVVVDNASTDLTAQIAQSVPGVAVVKEPAKDLAHARRTGLYATTGELVANVDADTIVPAGWLSRALEEFEQNPALVALSGPFVYYDGGLFLRAAARMYYSAAYFIYLVHRFILRIGSVLQGGNFIVRRDAILKVGGYRDHFRFYGEDTDVACRLARVGAVKFSFKLSALSSARRLKREGAARVGLRYAMNFFWTTYLDRPFSASWSDVRE